MLKIDRLKIWAFCKRIQFDCGQFVSIHFHQLVTFRKREIIYYCYIRNGNENDVLILLKCRMWNLFQLVRVNQLQHAIPYKFLDNFARFNQFNFWFYIFYLRKCYRWIKCYNLFCHNLFLSSYFYPRYLHVI
jgi:hypothetical protein